MLVQLVQLVLLVLLVLHAPALHLLTGCTIPRLQTTFTSKVQMATFVTAPS